ERHALDDVLQTATQRFQPLLDGGPARLCLIAHARAPPGDAREEREATLRDNPLAEAHELPVDKQRMTLTHENTLPGADSTPCAPNCRRPPWGMPAVAHASLINMALSSAGARPVSCCELKRPSLRGMGEH